MSIRGVIAAVVISLGSFAPLCAADAAFPEPRHPKIGEEAFEEIRARGTAQVVIALERPAPPKSGAPVGVDLRRRIAEAQRAVLAALPPGGVRVQKAFLSVPALVVTVRSEATLMAIARAPGVVRVDLDVGGGGALDSSVPQIGADARHVLDNRGDGVVVAILDSGVDPGHADLENDLIHEVCLLDFDGRVDGVGLCPDGTDRQVGAGAARDDAGHGTHVTGIVTSDGQRSAVGVAPGAEVVAIKVTSGPAFSGRFAFFSELVAALDLIIDSPELGVRLINISLGTDATFEGDCDQQTAYNLAGSAAVETLRQLGVTTFASSGNHGSSEKMTSPACLRDVVAVGAVDRDDRIAGFSNQNQATDLLAPGVGIVSSGLEDRTAGASGTSMAVAHATACAALLIEQDEEATPERIESLLKQSTVDVEDPVSGLVVPRIDCRPGGQPCPGHRVFMESASVSVSASGPILRWNTASEGGLAGFLLSRLSDGIGGSSIESLGGLIESTGDEATGANYSYLDDSKQSGEALEYYIEEVDVCGRKTLHGPLTVRPGPSGPGRSQSNGIAVRRD